MRFAALVAIVLAACASLTSTTNEPVVTGDRCEAYATRTACETHRECDWSGPFGCPGCGSSEGCPPCTPDPDSGICTKDCSNGCVVELSPGCACPDDNVCYEQIAGTSSPDIACITPAPGDGDPCARIAGQGACTASTSVTGLCICDNSQP